MALKLSLKSLLWKNGRVGFYIGDMIKMTLQRLWKRYNKGFFGVSTPGDKYISIGAVIVVVLFIIYAAYRTYRGF